MKRTIATGFVLAVLFAVPAFAQHHHPAYQHAMADLDRAGTILKDFNRPDVANQVESIRKEIWDAYNDLMKAGHLDKKDMPKDYEPDLGAEKGPLHQARHLIEAAHRDTSEPEDDASAQPLQQNAMGHMDQAMKLIDEALSSPEAPKHGGDQGGNNEPPPPPSEGSNPNRPESGSNFVPHPGEHPAYLHALADLRLARAHVEHDSRGGLQAEEKEAVNEIDRTMDEIHKASLDDGKDLNDHPPVDPNLDRPGLLHKALELIDKAHRDISEKETDDFAQGLRQRALHHLEEAQHHLQAALNVTEGK
jgi:hypothetical protein